MSNKSHLCPLYLNSDFEFKNVGCILFMIRGNKNYTINMGEKNGRKCLFYFQELPKQVSNKYGLK